MWIHVVPPGFPKSSPSAASQLPVEQGRPVLTPRMAEPALDLEAGGRYCSFSSLFMGLGSVFFNLLCFRFLVWQLVSLDCQEMGMTSPSLETRLGLYK